MLAWPVLSRPGTAASARALLSAGRTLSSAAPSSSFSSASSRTAFFSSPFPPPPPFARSFCLSRQSPATLPNRPIIGAARAVRSASTASAPTPPGSKKLLPERLLVYHAGTPRTTFLACLKVSTLFGLAFFTFLVVPAYAVQAVTGSYATPDAAAAAAAAAPDAAVPDIAAAAPAARKQPWNAGLTLLAYAACGLVPFAYVAYTTAPYVVFAHLRLPAYARHPDAVRRFVRNVPPATRLELTTMSLVGRARRTAVAVGDLAPAAPERLRVVTLADRSAAAATAAAGDPLLRRRPGFPWLQLRPPRRFGAPAASNSRGTREGWAWDELLAAIARRAAEGGGPNSGKRGSF